MKITIDTKEDSPEEIRKVIKMLQHVIGDTGEVFTNQESSGAASSGPLGNIFDDLSHQQDQASGAPENPIAASDEISEQAKPQPQSGSDSTDDLFEELFNQNSMSKGEPEQEEEESIPQKKKSYEIDFY